VKGVYATTEQEAVKLAVLQLRVGGPYNQKTFISTFSSNPSTYLPSKFHKEKRVHKQVEKDYQVLTKETPNLDPDTAKHNYLNQCRLFKRCGIFIFKNIKYSIGKSEIETDIFIGISRDSFFIYKTEEYLIHNEIKLNDIEYQYTKQNGTFKLRIGGLCYNFSSKYFSEIIDYLSEMFKITAYKNRNLLIEIY